MSYRMAKYKDEEMIDHPKVVELKTEIVNECFKFLEEEGKFNFDKFMLHFPQIFIAEIKHSLLNKRSR